MAVFSLAIAGVLAASPSWAARLGSPAHQAVVSGIGVISGWKCEAKHYAIDRGEVALLLLAAGADPNARSRYFPDIGFLFRVLLTAAIRSAWNLSGWSVDHITVVR